MNKTLEANNIFLNPTNSVCNTKTNLLLQYCYKSLEILEGMKGQIGVDQFNYIQEYFNRIIMILNDTKQKPMKNVFNHDYNKNNINNLPVNYTSFTWDQQLRNAEYNNQTLSVPAEYKVLTSLDKQLAYNKWGEKVIVPFKNITDNNPLENAINASQYIAGNGFDISRHLTPMPLNKYK